MKIAVLISAVTEWLAVKDVLMPGDLKTTIYGECFDIELRGMEFRFFHSGWGKTASAGAMQYVIDHYRPHLIVNLGTCGGFEGLAELDEIILVERTFIYDIVELMGDFGSVLEYYESKLDLNWLSKPYPHTARRGVIASADSDLSPDRIPELTVRGAIAADWESAALAWVAQKNGARLLILRAVSDLVSVDGGEAYDNITLYKERTKCIMKRLITQLPDWVSRIRVS